jgi:hypothetical protein
MVLKSAVDYGLGTSKFSLSSALVWVWSADPMVVAYWANEGAAAPTAEAPSQSQAPIATPSQARTVGTATQTGTQPLAKGRRKLLAADAGDEPMPKATRGRKKTIATILEDDELDEPNVEVVEPSGGTRGTRRGTRGTTSRAGSVMGDSTQAEEYMPLRGSSTTVAPGTAATGTASGKANRKRMIMNSDDDDEVSNL